MRPSCARVADRLARIWGSVLNFQIIVVAIPVDQLPGTLIDGKLGDCWQACVASILEIPPTNIPHFAELHGLDRMAFETDVWLRQRGMSLRFLERERLVSCLFNRGERYVEAGART
jgi:hypothetical protein